MHQCTQKCISFACLSDSAEILCENEIILHLSVWELCRAFTAHSGPERERENNDTDVTLAKASFSAVPVNINETRRN